MEYITMPGWKTNTAHTTDFLLLATNAQAYVRKIEELIGVPSETYDYDWRTAMKSHVDFGLLHFIHAVQWIGTGKSRKDMICRF